ncbi:MAG: hypothetical protein JW709_13010 [Sedimentisphaerales bacterium]|nr:hypothetical protein [Sedimentisphaerales bacterium]
MPLANTITIFNCRPLEIGQIPVLDIAVFRNTIIDAVANGQRIAALFAAPTHDQRFFLYALLADDNAGELYVLSAETADTYPALTPDCPQAHLFEREIAEQWAIKPLSHPWLKPVRFHPGYRPGRDAWNRKAGESILPCVTDFYTVVGEEIHEVAVGPVHAGIIEPGHFRFQCHGENVLHLEISLGYQHRGVERAVCGGPNKRTLPYMQTLAGDTTIGHTTAYSHLVESLGQTPTSPRAESLRGIALELERLANHTGGLGALAGDIGYLPTASFCGRIRGDFLNLTALLCGNRFGRGLIQPGGVRFDVTSPLSITFLDRFYRFQKDVTVAVELLWNTPSVLARFEEAGALTPQICRELGLVGVPARACGLEMDCRYNFPAGVYRFSHIPVSTWHSGDVFARAYVRWLEIQKSIAFIIDQMNMLPEGPVITATKPLIPNRLCVSLVEGWRGEICHIGITDSQGIFRHYKIVDPSFHNWTGLAMALRNQQISDFPLCNKSFDLSYCGHDL